MRPEHTGQEAAVEREGAGDAFRTAVGKAATIALEALRLALGYEHVEWMLAVRFPTGSRRVYVFGMEKSAYDPKPISLEDLAPTELAREALAECQRIKWSNRDVKLSP